MKLRTKLSSRDMSSAHTFLLLVLTLLLALDPRHQSVDAKECEANDTATSAECGFCVDRKSINISIFILELTVLPNRCSKFRLLGYMPTTPFMNFSQLETLIMTGNTMSTQLQMPFDFGQLKYIDLSNNGFYNIETQFPDSLVQLNLSNNRLDILTSSTFTELDELVTLDLSGNPLHTIESGVFDNLYAIQEIRLNGADLSRAPDSLFYQVPSLRRLYMQRCKMHDLPRRLLAGTTLDILDLTGNRLMFFPAAALLEASTVPLTLILAANVIEEVWDLRGMSFDRLDLSLNPLSRIQEDAFFDSTISQLDLGSTNLVGLPRTMDSLLRNSSTVLKLDHTSWDCNCSTVWLGFYLQDSPTSVSPTCKLQGNYGGMLLRSIAFFLNDLCKYMPMDKPYTFEARTYLKPEKFSFIRAAVVGSIAAIPVLLLPIMCWVFCSSLPRIDDGW